MKETINPVEPLTTGHEQLQQRLRQRMQEVESLANNISPTDAADWAQYQTALRSVAIANWATQSELEMRFGVIRSALNEIR